MAYTTVAGKWLQENGYTWKGVSGVPKAKATQRERPVFYCEHDMKAFRAQRKAETQSKRGIRYSRGEVKIRLGIHFLWDNIDFDGLECLYYPHTKGRDQSVVIDGKTENVARAMCILKHGQPNEEKNIARHLCGNGHFCCVNPTHLRWGTPMENTQDKLLHRKAPHFFREIGRDEAADIKADPRHPNVMAIEREIPTAIILMIKNGTYIQWEPIKAAE